MNFHDCKIITTIRAGQEIFDKLCDCDVIVLATPIYSWFCTPPMKSLLDRLVYGMNKYYGDEKGPSLWAMAAQRDLGYKSIFVPYDILSRTFAHQIISFV